MSIDVFRPYVFLAGGALALFALFLGWWVQSRWGNRAKFRSASHAVIPTVYLAGLLYALVHFNVGIACDFRYLYFPVVASIITMAYVFWTGFATVFASRLRRSAGV